MPPPSWICAPLVVLPVLADSNSLAQFPLSKSAAGPLVDFPDESLVVEADSEALTRMFELGEQCPALWDVRAVHRSAGTAA